MRCTGRKSRRVRTVCSTWSSKSLTAGYYCPNLGRQGRLRQGQIARIVRLHRIGLLCCSPSRSAQDDIDTPVGGGCPRCKRESGHSLGGRLQCPATNRV
jgi:hypothetical protein